MNGSPVRFGLRLALTFLVLDSLGWSALAVCYSGPGSTGLRAGLAAVVVAAGSALALRGERGGEGCSGLRCW